MKQQILSNNKVILTVIIPVFNAKGFLDCTIKSLMLQDFNQGELQIVCIDDGSTDGSADYIEELVKMEGINCLELIKQKNSGVSAARNRGMSYIKGRYFCFLDADDAYKPGYLKRICEQMDKLSCSVAEFGFTRVFNYEKKKDIDLSIKVGVMSLKGYVWPYIFNYKYFGNIRFDEKLKYAEDTFFTQLVTLHEPKCLCVNNEVYIYRNNTSSLMNNRKGNVVAESMLLLAKNHNQLLLENVFIGKENIIRRWRDRACALFIYWRLRGGNKQEPFSQLKSYGFYPYKKEWNAIIPHNFSKIELKRCIAAFLLCIIGYKPFWRLFSLTEILGTF